MRRKFALPCSLLSILLLAGCGGKKQVKLSPPPTPGPSQESGIAADHDAEAPARQRGTRPSAHVLYSEVGTASWYGPPYNNRRGANGQIYDMNAMTAAHKTLPLNSVVRVTNLKTGKSVVVRITDRGPFIGDRILDLSLAAARALDVWRAGTARVRLEVLEAPAPIETGGRWAVQIGAFHNAAAASRMRSLLLRRYRSANVLQFAGPTGEWVRVRVPQDEKSRAQEIARNTATPEGSIFLVRLD